MALAISSNKHHTHTNTHTHTSSHETRGNQRVVLPPAKPPSLLLTAPPRSPTNPYPNHPATSRELNIDVNTWHTVPGLLPRNDDGGLNVTMYTFDDGSAAQECVFLRAQRASLRHTAAGIPQGGGGVCGTQTGVVICMCSNVHTWYLHQRHG